MFPFFLGRNRYGGLMYGTERIRIATGGSLRAPGLLYQHLNADCPQTFAESAAGILLTANGIDPMLRWDGIEWTAIPAGVPAPSTPFTMSGRNALNTTTGNPSGGGAYEEVTFNFIRFGRLATQTGLTGPQLAGPGGNYLSAAFKARQDAWNQYSARIYASYTAAEIGVAGGDWTPVGGALAMHLPSGIRGKFFGRTWSGDGFVGYRRSFWTHLKFTLRLKVVLPGATVPTSPSITGDYSAFQQFVDKWGNVSNPGPLVGPVAVSGASQIVYEGCETPADPRIVLRRFWRTARDEAETYFLDFETDDLSQTTFTSSKDDTQLELGDPVALYSNEGVPLYWLFGLPPSSKPYLLAIQDRMAAAGDRPYREGAIAVTFGSTTVTGIGTALTPSMAGRFLFSLNDPQPYEILTVNATAQTFELADAYRGATDPFLTYAIRAGGANSAEHNRIYFTTLGLPEGWPASNAIDMNEDGDEITGLLSYAGYAYILKRRSIYRIFFDEIGLPVTYPVLLGRGAAGQGCVVEADGICYLLDEMGVHAFNGQGTEPVSHQIQDIFRADGNGYRIGWHHACRFHAVHAPDRHTVRWFVCLSGLEQPRHALCYNYRLERWQIEEYPTAITASVLATVSGRLRALGATGDGRICAMDYGSLDLVDAGAGTTRFIPTAVTLFSVTTTETLPATLVGATLCVCDGRGRGQLRRIVAASSGVLTINQPWTVLPAIADADLESTLQIGGIKWQWKSKAFGHVKTEKQNPRGVWLQWKPTTVESLVEVRTYRDERIETIQQDYRSDGVTGVAADEALTVQLQRPDPDDPDRERNRQPGAARIDRDAWQERDLPNMDSIEVELSGFTGAEPTVIREVAVPGVEE